MAEKQKNKMWNEEIKTLNTIKRKFTTKTETNNKKKKRCHLNCCKYIFESLVAGEYEVI